MRIYPTLRSLISATIRWTLSNVSSSAYSPSFGVHNADLSNCLHRLELECLRHLRDLKADGNNIVSLDGISQLDSLVRVSLKGNCIKDANFATFKWSRVETLDLGNNAIRAVYGLGALSALVSLTLGEWTLFAWTTLRVESNPPTLSASFRGEGGSRHPGSCPRLPSASTLAHADFSSSASFC